jgi:hypothetical protein
MVTEADFPDFTSTLEEPVAYTSPFSFAVTVMFQTPGETGMLAFSVPDTSGGTFIVEGPERVISWLSSFRVALSGGYAAARPSPEPKFMTSVAVSSSPEDGPEQADRRRKRIAAKKQIAVFPLNCLLLFFFTINLLRASAIAL